MNKKVLLGLTVLMGLVLQSCGSTNVATKAEESPAETQAFGAKEFEALVKSNQAVKVPLKITNHQIFNKSGELVFDKQAKIDKLSQEQGIKPQSVSDSRCDGIAAATSHWYSGNVYGRLAINCYMYGSWTSGRGSVDIRSPNNEYAYGTRVEGIGGTVLSIITTSAVTKMDGTYAVKGDQIGTFEWRDNYGYINVIEVSNYVYPANYVTYTTWP